MDSKVGGFGLKSTGGTVAIESTGATKQVSIKSEGNTATAVDISASAGGIKIDAKTSLDLDCDSTFTLNAGTTIDINSDGGGNIKIGGTIAADNSDIYLNASYNGSSVAKNSKTVLMDRLDVNGTTQMRDDVTITGNLTVNGTTSTLNTVTITAADKNIELNSSGDTDATDSNANGGGIDLKVGTSPNAFVSFTWNNTENSNNGAKSWDSTEDINVASGKSYAIAGVVVLSSTHFHVKTISTNATNDTLDDQPAIYLNQATPGISAAGQWRIKTDQVGDVVFQKRSGTTPDFWQNKFRIT